MNRIPLEKKVLSDNDRVAAQLRDLFRQHQILCLNLISSPGAGKTSLLERTLEGFAPGERVAVLTGDGALLLKRVQRHGGKSVRADEILNDTSRTLGS